MRFSGELLADLLRRRTSVPRLRILRQVFPVEVDELFPVTVVPVETAADDVMVCVALANELVVANFVGATDEMDEDEIVDLYTVTVYVASGTVGVSVTVLEASDVAVEEVVTGTTLLEVVDGTILEDVDSDKIVSTGGREAKKSV